MTNPLTDSKSLMNEQTITAYEARRISSVSGVERAIRRAAESGERLVRVEVRQDQVDNYKARLTSVGFEVQAIKNNGWGPRDQSESCFLIIRW